MLFKISEKELKEEIRELKKEVIRLEQRIEIMRKSMSDIIDKTEEEFWSKVNTEAFLDDIIERIRRKQL